MSEIFGLDEKEFEAEKAKLTFSCRFHPTDWFHEVGCEHMEWTKEKLLDALKTQKAVVNQYVKQSFAQSSALAARDAEIARLREREVQLLSQLDALQHVAGEDHEQLERLREREGKWLELVKFLSKCPCPGSVFDKSDSECANCQLVSINKLKKELGA